MKIMKKITMLGYNPVGLGKKYFDKNWLRDSEGENISHKNEFYGEYSFHYWLWKNKISELDDNAWVGFCAYRRFWSSDRTVTEIKKKEDFLSTVPAQWNNYENSLRSRNLYGWMDYNEIGEAWFKIFDFKSKIPI